MNLTCASDVSIGADFAASMTSRARRTVST